jgi:hypothetical protein
VETTLSSHDRIFLLFVSKHLFVLFVFFLSNMKARKQNLLVIQGGVLCINN